MATWAVTSSVTGMPTTTRPRILARSMPAYRHAPWVSEFVLVIQRGKCDDAKPAESAGERAEPQGVLLLFMHSSIHPDLQVMLGHALATIIQCTSLAELP